jgi:hypothetical protein
MNITVILAWTDAHEIHGLNPDTVNTENNVTMKRAPVVNKDVVMRRTKSDEVSDDRDSR